MDNTQVATKADVSELKSELKGDIKTVNTDIKKLEQSTKAEIRTVKTDIKYLRQAVLRVEERVENLEEGQTEIKTKLNKLQNTLDGFLGVVDDLRTDNTVGAHHTLELQIKIADHEKRLKYIESSKHAA